MNYKLKNNNRNKKVNKAIGKREENNYEYHAIILSNSQTKQNT